MTSSSPWYRWPIEIDDLPNQKMVDLSMAMLFFTRWYIDIWGLWKHVLHSFFLVHHHRFQVIPPYFLQKKGPGIGWNPGVRKRVFRFRYPLAIHEVPLKPSWNHHETTIPIGHTMTKPCLFSMLTSFLAALDEPSCKSSELSPVALKRGPGQM